MTSPWAFVALILFGYFEGSILYAVLLPKMMKGIDLTKVSEDGNPGSANAFQYCGIWVGFWTAVGDFAKGFLPVFISYWIWDWDDIGIWYGFIILAPILGHMFSMFHRFNGGMGIACTTGTLIALFVHSLMVVMLVSLYAVSRFIPFKRRYQRTWFCWSIFAVLVILLESNWMIKWPYIIISAVIIIMATIQKYVLKNARDVNDELGENKALNKIRELKEEHQKKKG